MKAIILLIINSCLILTNHLSQLLGCLSRNRYYIIYAAYSFLLSPLIYAFIDQTSVRFNLVYFLIISGALGLVLARKISGENFQIPKEIKAFWLLFLSQSFISSIFTTNSVPISAIGLSITLSALIYFSFGAAVKISFRKWIPIILFLSSIIFSLISLAMAVGVTPVPVNQSNLLPGRLAITGLPGYWRYCFRHRSY